MRIQYSLELNFNVKIKYIINFKVHFRFLFEKVQIYIHKILKFNLNLNP